MKPKHAPSVVLEYQEDPHEISGVLATDGAELFTETVLIVPVRFRVDGQDMLRIGVALTTIWSVDASGTAAPIESVELEYWTPQPILGFLLGLRHAIDEAQRSGQSRCYLIERPDLTFKLRDGSQLEVTSPNGTTTAIAPVDEFVEAIELFEQDIRAWLEGRAPQLVRHPSWAEWFPKHEL